MLPFSSRNYGQILPVFIFLVLFLDNSSGHALVAAYGDELSWPQDGSLDSFFEEVGLDGKSRFRRQIANLRSSLKRQFSSFNDDLNPQVVPVYNNNSYFDGSDIKIPANETLLQENHIYYDLTLFNTTTSQERFFVDLDRINETLIHHEALSKSHLKAAGVQLSFDFPFYGMKIRNLTLATGGFLFTGNPDHSWIAATQYIAPLMADFSFDAENDSMIRYHDNGSVFTVQWKNAKLFEKPEAGNFTFQVTLKSNGDIIFFYNRIPIPISKIPNETHPVKIGVSDAYMIDRQRFIIRYRTIYEYHRIALQNAEITSGSAILLKALPTCIALNSCSACLVYSVSLNCRWCESLQRCSDGVDRFHQEWYSKGCHDSSSNTTCKPLPTTKYPYKFTKSTTKTSKSDSPTDVPKKPASEVVLDYSAPPKPSVSGTDDLSLPDKSKYTFLKENLTVANRAILFPIDSPMPSAQSSSTNAGYGIAIAAVLSVVLIGSIVGWVAYAYIRPHSPSGQWLIRYRPSQWRRSRDDEVQIANTAF